MANFSGKWKMTNISDCFNIGSIVACRTCYQKNIEGEVLAFDAQTKILILSILFIRYPSLLYSVHLSPL